MIRGLRRQLSSIINPWIMASDGEELARRYNFSRRFRPHQKVALDFEDDVFVLDDGKQKLAVARKERLGLNLYGMENRQERLLAEYGVDNDMIRPGDVVVDCGANIGEFSIICARLGAEVLAFEPDRREYAALSWNAKGKSITALPLALWHETAELDFYDSNDMGDSSLFDPGDATQSYKVQACPLDLVEDLPDGPIRLIKLEAEGAEPEILDGMAGVLERVDYVTADMGPERGLSKANTVVEVNDRLIRHGFRLSKFNEVRCTGLFEAIR